ncbi:hypothetical protein COY65_01030 [Candidatus Jorgensenbacteria bacterium CG_4_10_14_0_8_um_filter_39_13]|uniref:Uncharacterized protein n=2 Tax=Candidatus Joergenseniibacteriota TaxID=1752739 RepID=A0A2M7RHT7_9BACT|nr:MAG: hypothetical protein COV54_01455 [Candidatus Jorgensenbacteria bacterium CG11_big_fil_rev_8_21_14_0_20_38_23]PIV13469.1 MAG: hypothetical protein COS46_00015 [Candidatus Jorgensenbacteria bacterium CG03_land_8_20_14_0_80_38_39]PIW97488.1 MAG: hypothetical protein COZ81_02250 [Candidatus Jorgensenbacteria bacterium CG_4_8_14_3_um_filter_38_10]PIY96308.1 MAG: hypothetical protein COY65_01030 [Candidatus Jorgensenbacteria bacterium CG_4_10_14_0_8_um_filter_39_13]PJA95247.1 MAG: hypothetica
MVKQLKLLLINPTVWKLTFKVLIGLLVIYLSQLLNFSWLAGFIFFISWLLIYFSFSSEKQWLFSSFWLTGFYTFWGFKIILNFPVRISTSLLIYFAAGLIFFLLFGLMNLYFKNRLSAYSFFQDFLLMVIFLIFFHSLSLPWLFPLGFVLFFSLFFLFKEVFSFAGLNFYRRHAVISLLLALGTVEVAWLVGFLPLGFINGAIFLTLFSFICRDTALTHFKGGLTLSFVFIQISLFLLLSLIIFIFSPWSLT